jgi:hypothetical protein
MKEGCLHCQLIKTFEKWLKGHSASEDEILTMCSQFIAQVAGGLPEQRGLEEINVVILGRTHTHKRSTLH